MPVILWTDALIYLLVAGAVTGGWFASKHEHLRAPFAMIVRSRVGVAALVVLMSYAAIGLLDTVHFHPELPASQQTDKVRYSSRILSLFDLIATSLRTRTETTYSAPFATHGFVKQSVELGNGTTERVYPRLKWGGAHLRPDQSRAWDILSRTVWAALLGLLAALVITSGIVLLLARRRKERFRMMLRSVWTRQTEIPWRLALFMLSGVIVFVFVTAYLSQYYHILGTDKVGEDVFYQTLKSIRTGLVIGTITTLIMLPAAILMGIMAGYYRGWIDDVIQYLYTTLNAVPGVLLIAAAILMLHVFLNNHQDEFNSLVERADLRLLFLCVILGITSWTSLCRLLRAETLKLREMDYVQASLSAGVSKLRIMLRHILPNVMHIVFITVALDFSGLVLAEAVLSYVNIGVDPSTDSWGNMINSARLELAREPVVWWSLSAALIFMFVLVLAANLFSDVVRDAFDPHLRGLR